MLLIALLIENPLHAGNILGKDKHTESFVKKAEQFQFYISTRAETRSTVNLQVWVDLCRETGNLSLHYQCMKSATVIKFKQTTKRIWLWKAPQI